MLSTASERMACLNRRCRAPPTPLPVPRTRLLRPCSSSGTFTTSTNGVPTTRTPDVTVNLPASDAPTIITFPEQLPGVAPPPAAYKKNVDSGAAKAALPAWRTFLLGIMAGCFISYGGFLACTVGANMPGLASSNVGLAKLITGLIFPFGLLMVMICGAELYTGNTALLAIAVYEKRASLKDLVRNWFWSYTGNLIGSLAMVAAIAGSGMLANNPLPVSMAIMKTSLPFGQVVLRAILCNWLVCVAVWQSNAASTLSGKVLGLWPPITAFVTIGLEHSVANMFFVPMGIALGANVTFSHFLTSNLLPVTLGNTIAGVLLMATPYALAYGALGKKLDNLPAAV